MGGYGVGVAFRGTLRVGSERLTLFLCQWRCHNDESICKAGIVWKIREHL